MLPQATANLLPPLQTGAAGIAISATSTVTAGVALPQAPGDQPGTTVRVVSEGPSIAFLAFGNARLVAATLPTATATTTCDAILPGEDLIFSLKPGDLAVSAICRAGGSALLTVYVGYGQ